ncbi:MAG: TatD family hydrolase [Gammaproteobacteria bacterium]|jgi:TatD DNase family protein|nr:TatD family hydrolase [Gammaproteobacteria bacterium]
MKLFDSHCHLDFSAFHADRTAVVARACERGIQAIFVPGVSYEQSQQYAWLNDCKAIDIFRGFGLHPYFIEQHQNHDLDWLETQLAQHGTAAVGEVGLDATCSNYELQYKLFCEQVELACKYQRSLVLHHRKTQAELLRVIKPLRAKLPEYPGVIHAFSGSAEQANEWTRMGFMLGVGGTITYERAKKTRAAIAQTSSQHLVLETDAPDMPVAGYQGQRNEPQYLLEILNQLALLKEQPVEELAHQTWQNSQKLFHRV